MFFDFPKPTFNFYILLIVVVISFLLGSAFDIEEGFTWEQKGNYTLDPNQQATNEANDSLQLTALNFGPTTEPVLTNAPTQMPTTTIPVTTAIPTPTTAIVNYCPSDSTRTNNCTECPATEMEGVICENKVDGRCPDFAAIDCTQYSSCSSYADCIYNHLECTENSCLYVLRDRDAYEAKKDICGDHPICWGKPVIYLYPEKPMYVDVVLDIPGKITVSDPLYPKEGWQNVFAHPDGKLVYNGKEYRELFYETAVDQKVIPQQGVFIPTSALKETLTDYTQRLGLIAHEQEELLDYWLPRLIALKKPYIFFSVLTEEQKAQAEKVTIEPTPDTFIAFLMYFKGVDALYPISPLTLPQQSPQRVGFTAVEWGGTIDAN
jgi:hypothetical protein